MFWPKIITFRELIEYEALLLAQKYKRYGHLALETALVVSFALIQDFGMYSKLMEVV